MDIGTANLFALLETEGLKDFKSWKSHRESVVSWLGQRLLEESEWQLTQIFAAWEHQIMDKAKSDDNDLAVLLAISVLHHYHRSFDQMKKLFPIVISRAASVNRSVCRAATTTMRHLAEENTETFTFSREAIEKSRYFMSAGQRDTYLFNALSILRECGRFLPTDVFGITLHQIPEIWSAICSSDRELQNIAAKVMGIHLASVPASTAENFAESLTVDCFQRLDRHAPNTHGVIRTLEAIYELFPQFVNLQNYIDKLVEGVVFPNTSGVPIESFKFIVKLAKNNPGIFTTEKAKQIFIGLSNAFKEPTITSDLFELTNEMIHLMPTDSIPIDQMTALISNFSRVKGRRNLAYGILCTLFEKFPRQKAPIELFTAEVPCRNCLHALRMRIDLLMESKDKLMEYFEQGVSITSPKRLQKFALRLLTIFQNVLFEKGVDHLFPTIRKLGYSEDEKIRLLVAGIMHIFSGKEAVDELIRLATMDESKHVRICSLKHLSAKAFLNRSRSLIQLLADASYGIRRIAIPFVAEVAKYDALYSIPSIVVFVNSFIVQNISHGNTRRSAKACSLLPLIAEHFVPLVNQFVPSITWLCVWFLSHGEPLEKVEPDDGDTFGSRDLATVVNRDFIARDFMKPYRPGEINLERIYNAENAKSIGKCESFLFITLKKLAKYVRPYLKQIIPVFIKRFVSQCEEYVCLSAISALTEIIIFNSDVNWPLLFPKLLPSLMELISDDKVTQKATVAVLRLTGTMGASVYVSPLVSDENDQAQILSIPKMSFFTTFVLEKLRDHFKDPSPGTCATYMAVFVKDSQNAMSFLGGIIEAFVAVIKRETNRDLLFNQLELIVMYATVHIVPFLDTMLDILLSNIGNISCLRCCISLSYHLKSDFNGHVNALYSTGLRLLREDRDIMFFKTLLKFISFAILYQNQNAELFVEKTESIIWGLSDAKATFLLKSLTQLVQARVLTMVSSRLSRICFSILKKRSNIHEVNQLIFTLCLYSDLPVDMVELYLSNTGLVIPYLSNIRTLMESPQAVLAEIESIKNTRNNLATDHLDVLIKELEQDNGQSNAFMDLPQPVFNNAKLWINDLCGRVVSCSPSPSIRSCSQIIGQSQAFCDDLFPIAFLSCWMATFRIQDRASLSKTITMILEQFDEIEPVLIDLAELTDRAGVPLLVPDKVLAKASKNPGRSLRFLQRYIRDHPDDRKAIKELLALNSRMSFQSSAMGLLVSSKNHLNDDDTGIWSEELGDWEKAISIYVNQNPQNTVRLVTCYARLEQWDDILALKDEFEQMKRKDKKQVAIWFAWAEYHAKNLENVKKYLEYVNVVNRDSILFKCIYAVASQKYEEAEKWIRDGFLFATRSCSIFAGSDANEASKTMVFAQHLIELQETLDFRRNKTVEPPAIWKYRLQNFSYDSEAWMKLTEIRELVLKPEDHVESFLKMISVLRKERKWKLVDVYYDRFFGDYVNTRVILSRLKVMWDKGCKQKAFDLISAVNRLIKMDEESLLEVDIPADLEGLFTHFERPDPQLLGRMLRIQAYWQLELCSDTSNAEEMNQITQLLEESKRLLPNDYRVWREWAFVNSKTAEHAVEDKGQIVLSAVSGFLKAAQLDPAGSLEYLCQMFSMFFRYGEEFELSRELHNEIVSLPPSIVIQIIPQIVVHIAHKVPTIRQVVQDIITVFSNDHFEAVVFPLNVLSMIDGSEKTPIAKFVDLVASHHTDTYNDAKLFIDGMHHAAVIWIEEWLTTLDKVSRSNQADKREENFKMLYERLKTPQSQLPEMSRYLIQMFAHPIQRCIIEFRKYYEGDKSNVRQLWEALRSFYNQMDAKMRKMETLNLGKISGELASKRGFKISIPGTYRVERTVPRLDYVDPVLRVIQTQARPRIFYMINSEGVRSKFLLKGNEDLRLDQRIMQLFKLTNSLLRANRNTNEIGASIQMYEVVPFAPNAGLISWVTGSDTLQQLVSDYRTHRRIRVNMEMECYQQFCGPVYNYMNGLQRREVFDEIASKCHADELRESLWLRAPSTTAWIKRNRNFTISTALMSMAGYTIGLGDRHPNNIMIQRQTGRVIHIDFGDSFEVAMNRSVYKERVPFRLTRMISNALDGGILEGLFRKSCEDVLWVLRENQNSIISQLEVFVHEPIFDGKEIRSGEKAAKKILERVGLKLSGKDPLPFDQPDLVYSASEQVDVLIRMASDPNLYGRHFLGWCPFW